MDNHERFARLLDLLDEVMNKLASEHMAPHTFGTGVRLHRTEIHTIQAIGENEGINLTKLADLMKVTKGAISQTISKLNEKKMVKKTYKDDNAKEIELYLTKKGKVGFINHSSMHMRMYDIVMKYYGPDFGKKLKEFSSVMEDLNSILELLDKEKAMV
jgi:DNA-binding MarR family transcriptional regulator